MCKLANSTRTVANWVNSSVKIVQFLKHFAVLPNEIAHQHKPPHHKAGEGSELPEVNNEEVQTCPQKTIVLDKKQLDNLYKHQNHHALVEPHEKIVKEYLARMGGSYSVVSAHSGRLLQKVTGYGKK